MYQQVFVCRVLYGDQQPVQIQRFLDKVVGAFFDGLDCRVYRSVSRYHDNRGVGGKLLDVFQYFDALHFGHFYIAEYNIRFLRLHCHESFHAVLGKHDFVSLVLENIFHGIADTPLVVNHKYFCHSTSFLSHGKFSIYFWIWEGVRQKLQVTFAFGKLQVTTKIKFCRGQNFILIIPGK